MPKRSKPSYSFPSSSSATPENSSAPHSRESELGLLGCMVLKNEIIPEVLCVLEDESFYMESTQIVFAHLKKVWERDKLVDLVMLKDSIGTELESIGGVEFLAGIVEAVPNTASWLAYTKVIARKALQREQADAARKILEAIDEDAEEGEIYKLADTIKKAVGREEGKDIETVVQDGIHIMDEVRNTGREMSWGWEEIDRSVGGLRRKTTYVLGAKTSQGKTTVASNLVVNALNQGKRVLMCVLENPDQVSLRLAAIDSEMPLGWFLKPEQISEDNFKLAKESLKSLERWEGRLKVVGATPLPLLKSIAEKFKPDIVILDYLQKYAARYCNGKQGTKAAEVGRAASDFGDIAIDCNAAGVLLSQVSRRMEAEKGRKPALEDLKESGDIENYADVVMMLYWPWRDTRNEKKDPLLYEIDIAKNKLGPPSISVSLKINPETLKITPWKEEQVVKARRTNVEEHNPAPTGGGSKDGGGRKRRTKSVRTEGLGATTKKGDGSDTGNGERTDETDGTQGSSGTDLSGNVQDKCARLSEGA